MRYSPFTLTGSSLKLLKPGERGIVARLVAANDRIARKLKELGIVPGMTIRVEQRSPRFIIQAGLTRLALSDEMIQAIYVRLPSH
ncbi:MAG: ferrous iron transport protein A [Synechococcales cyanobacterium M58_A2018_015]|nr:ferrous iron transport protein A [Synechococcales cyanobacterium M58_A2018_015]